MVQVQALLKLCVRIGFACALLLGVTSPAQAAGARHVFIISFDGGKPSVMQASAMPLFKQMAQQGASTMQAFTVVPSITLVSHTSMLTGVQPNKHLIDWNEWSPEKGLVQVPTIFALAKKHGLITGLIAGKDKLKHLNTANSLDLFAIPAYAAQEVATTAAEFIRTKKPNLTFIHFADSDGAGHEFGWGSEQQKAAFAAEDSALEQVRKAITQAGIERDSVIILTADHGGHDKTHGSTRLDDMHIPWVAWGKGVRPGFVLKQRVNTYDTAATALWLLGVAIPKEFDGVAVKEAFN
ncbi:MAG TPA: ectonucleotide pyrophosphatase/phosphodiesterase [Cellvibrionaceae bacterium]|nr:ectonucleotide pyrophosphatase/phosphodiesterase [Cellvibrionaceae bacterium]